MEFSIDIHPKLNGEILIEDFSKEYNQYIPEDVDVVATFDKYKYSESATLNSIVKVSTDHTTLIDVLLNEHTEDVDSCTFKVKEDGYYVVTHMILPTRQWYNNLTNKDNWETIYIFEDDKIYKEVDGELEECTVKEILERNIEGTTLQKCRIDVFYTGHLQQCYINYCKQLFDQLLDKCKNSTQDNLLYIRDFIWMTLNVIDYLIGFKQFMEAERLLSMFNRCGGFCSGHGHNKHIGCGCS